LGYEFWQKLTDVLEEATNSVSTIKMEEPSTCDFMVEKQSLHGLTTKTTALFTDTALRTSNITQSLRMPNVGGGTKCS